MKQLEQLPEMTAEMLGGLHAAQDLKDEILRDGALARKDGKKHYRNSPWAAVAPEKRRATHAGRVLATVCSFAFIIGLLVGIPLMIANPNHGNGALISTQIGGDPSAQPRSAHWRWICPRAASPSLSVKSPAIAASGPRPAGQTSRCCAWTAVTIVCLPTPPRWAAT